MELKVDSDQRNVSPKENTAKIESDPVAASTASEQRPIQEIDRNSQQPKNQTNGQMFAPDGLHQVSLYQISQMNTPVVISMANARPACVK
jgi:hypothetical protein